MSRTITVGSVSATFVPPFSLKVSGDLTPDIQRIMIEELQRQLDLCKTAVGRFDLNQFVEAIKNYRSSDNITKNVQKLRGLLRP